MGDAATASQLAGANETMWDQLASGIPALSFAAAANPMSVIDFSPIGGENRNFNMEAMRDGANGWPASRVSSSWAERWLHSDLRNMATPYVYTTYEKMLELGGHTE